MEKKLIRKMVTSCFLQYSPEEELLPINEDDFEEMCQKIQELKTKEPNANLYEIVNDIVYEYLTH